jgi:hypothetical protein
MRPMEVIVMKVVRKESRALGAGLIGAGISPLTGDGLDEAFGFAIGLRAIRSSEAVRDTELPAGGGKDPGAIGGAAIGQEALDANAVSGIKGDRLEEGIESTGDLFIGQETGKSEATVIINGDMERLDTGPRIALGAIARSADTRAREAAQLLDIEVEEFAREIAFVTLDRRPGRFERGEAMEAVATQHAGKGGLGNGEHHLDLGVRAAGTAEGDDLSFEGRAGLARLVPRSRRTIVKSQRKTSGRSASQPAPNGLLTDAESSGRLPQREAELVMSQSHLGSRERSQFGISVHVVRAGSREVACSSTTSLPDLSRADNVLKHDT